MFRREKMRKKIILLLALVLSVGVLGACTKKDDSKNKEGEKKRESHDDSRDSSDGCRVGGNLPPYIYNGTYNLNDKCCHENVRHEPGYSL